MDDENTAKKLGLLDTVPPVKRKTDENGSEDLEDTRRLHINISHKLELLGSNQEQMLETEEPEFSATDTPIKTYPYVTTRVSWTQRLRNWFSGS